MADATELVAPVEKEKKSTKVKTKEEIALSHEFDVNKKYMFELATENPERDLPVINMVSKRPAQHQKFKPSQNIVLTSQIVWNNQRRMIRYYDGCTSIFVDEQPKDKDTIEQLIRQTNKDKYKFLEGKFGCHGDEKMLLLYLNICSWNGESLFRTRSADTVFIPSNADKKAEIESDKLDQTEKALDLARKAKEKKMRIHAAYLGIATEDYDSGNELTEKEIRTAYRKEALRNSAHFIESYGNKSLEIRYYIDEALRKGVISNKVNPNKAVWGKNQNVICDISGLRSQDAIATKLFEFSQSEEGEEFLIQLKAINE